MPQVHNEKTHPCARTAVGNLREGGIRDETREEGEVRPEVTRETGGEEIPGKTVEGGIRETGTQVGTREKTVDGEIRGGKIRETGIGRTRGTEIPRAASEGTPEIAEVPEVREVPGKTHEIGEG